MLGTVPPVTPRPLRAAAVLLLLGEGPGLRGRRSGTGPGWNPPLGTSSCSCLCSLSCAQRPNLAGERALALPWAPPRSEPPCVPRRCGDRGAAPALPPGWGGKSQRGFRMRAGSARAPAEPRSVPAVLSSPSCHLRLVPIQVHPRVAVHPREGEQRSRAALWEGGCHLWASPTPPGVPREALEARLSRPWGCSQLPAGGQGLSAAGGVRAARHH